MFITSSKGEGFHLPDFIIPGAAKSGTTTLYKILSQHPGIFFPAARKEPFYFSFGDTQPAYTDNDFCQNLIWRKDDYLELYAHVPANKMAGDGSTSYLYTASSTISNMRELYGDRLAQVKVVIILRNPVERAFSHYTYLIRNGLENRSFQEAISPNGIETWKNKRWGFDYIKYGMYYEQVKLFMETFNHCKIVLTGDLKRSETIEDILSFLGVSLLQLKSDIKANPSGIPKSRMLVNLMRTNPFLKKLVSLLPEQMKHTALDHRDRIMSKMLVKNPIPENEKAYLLHVYREDIQNLASLIKRDLEKWLI